MFSLANLPMDTLSTEEIDKLIKDLENIKNRRKEALKKELVDNIADAIKKFHAEFPWDSLVLELEDVNECRTIEVDLNTFTGFQNIY